MTNAIRRIDDAAIGTAREEAMVCHARVTGTAFAISEGGPHVVVFEGEPGGVRVSRREPACGVNA